MQSATPPRKRHWAIWVAAILLFCSATFVLSQKTNSGKTREGAAGAGRRGASGPIPVAVTQVKKGDIGVYVNALGTVTPVYTVTVASRVVGALTKIMYREGQFVHKGDLLAEVDPRPYMAVLLQAQGQLARDQAILKNAYVDLNRYKAAFTQHAVPEQTVATQQASVEQEEGVVKIDQGNLQAAQVNVDYARIVSPIDGRVGLRTVDPGNIVQANGTTGIATITQLQPITVIFTMAEDYIDQVATQLRAGRRLSVMALDRTSQSQIAEGSVLTIDNQVDPATGTVRVRASFSNKDFRLFPNEFVNARLLVRTLRGVNLVPTAAVQRNNEQAFVYVVSAQGNSVQSRNVNITTSDGETAAITGVNPGDALVTDGFDRLTDGAKVRVKQQANGPAGNGA
jgi:membrane fusion protein, multidrug efflux system